MELVALNDAEIKYSTVPELVSGDEKGVGGIYNFVTKRGACRGKILKFLGLKLKLVRQLLGNIRVAFYKATTLLENFIQ